MRTAVLNISGTNAFNSIVKIWGTNPIAFNIFTQFGNDGKFTIQGFKNVDLYGIKLQGTVLSDPTQNQNAIFLNHNLQIILGGQNPRIDGINGAKINQPTSVKTFLTKQNPEYYFCQPIKSCDFVQVINMTFDGIAPQVISGVEFLYDFDLVLSYKFEGE